MPGAIVLVGAVRGLRSEGDRVASIFNRLRPDILGISISKEALEALERISGGPEPDQAAANPEEEAYIRGLSAFGDIVKPPPCFSEPLRLARALGIPAIALDMDEEHYTLAYCKHVGTLDMMRQGRSGKLFSDYEFAAESPEELVLEWDKLVNRLKGYRALEMAREAWIAKSVSGLARKGGTVLAVVELERLEGVGRELEAEGLEPTLER